MKVYGSKESFAIHFFHLHGFFCKEYRSENILRKTIHIKLEVDEVHDDNTFVSMDTWQIKTLVDPWSCSKSSGESEVQQHHKVQSSRHL